MCHPLVLLEACNGLSIIRTQLYKCYGTCMDSCKFTRSRTWFAVVGGGVGIHLGAWYMRVMIYPVLNPTQSCTKSSVIQSLAGQVEFLSIDVDKRYIEWTRVCCCRFVCVYSHWRRPWTLLQIKCHLAVAMAQILSYYRRKNTLIVPQLPAKTISNCNFSSCYLWIQ